THYAFTGVFDVWPTPAAADTITVWYVPFPTPLAANTDVPAIDEPYASKLLEFGALVDAGDFKGDPSTSQWQPDYAPGMARYQQQLDIQQGEMPGQFHQWGQTWQSSGDLVAGGY